jgi:aspartate kinase
MIYDYLKYNKIACDHYCFPNSFEKKNINLTNNTCREYLCDTLKTKIGNIFGNNIPIFGGYIPIGKKGTLETLGKGYSDSTAAILARIAGYSLYIWKESGGVFTGHPGKVTNPLLISDITMNEVRELTAFGNEVLHPLTSILANDVNLSITIKDAQLERNWDTNIIYDTDEISHLRVVSGISSKNNLLLFEKNITSGNIIDNLIFPNNPILISASNTKISSVMPKYDKWNSCTLPDSNLKSLDTHIEDDNLSIKNNRAIICCIGEKMRGHLGMAAEMMSTLSKNEINIEMLVQNPKEINISAVINQEDEAKAINALHNRFILTGI